MKAGPRRWVTAVILILACCIALVDAYLASDHLASRRFFAGIFAIMFMSLVFIGALGFSLWWHWKKSGHPIIGSSDHLETRPSTSDGPMSR
jgi:hypothetical protein